MRKAKVLKRTQFGNPILRQKAQKLSRDEILSDEIQQLIADIKFTLKSRNYGVGLAAPQVGESVALSVISIRPTKNHKERKLRFEQVIINPSYKGVGKKEPKWEGCLSFASKNSTVFAQTMRYKKVDVEFDDENGAHHQEVLEGLPAHVFQHETDHLSGILFPERVEDHTTWMNQSEYLKRIVHKRSK